MPPAPFFSVKFTMWSVEHDAWVEQARAVHIEDELARRGIKLRGKIERDGPCPRCGGDDRFSINTAKQVFNCRHCKVGGDVIALVMHLDGVKFIDACTTLAGPPPKNGKDGAAPEPQRICTTRFDYLDEAGAMLFVVGRYEYRNPDGSFVLKDGKRKKTFAQKRPDPDRPGQWIYNTDGVRIVPYKLPELIEVISNEHFVIVVEGETKVDFLAGWNMAATCNAGGAGKWKAEHSEFLRGADVVIIPDNDEPGRNHADVAGRSLQNVAKSVRVLELPNIGPKQDVIDWAKRGGTVERLHELIAEQAKPWTARAETDQQSGGEDNQASEQQGEEQPLPFINMSNWDNEPVPEQEWAVLDRIPIRQTSLFTGEGGYGKSTIQLHLCVAHVLGRDWLKTLPEPGPAIFFEAEDGEKTIHRRLAAIARHYDVTFNDMIRGELHIISMFGRDTVLATATRNGKIEPTKLYSQLLQAAGDIRPKMIGIASSANVFAGSEIDRTQTQQFVGLLNRLAMIAAGGVVLIAHPSLTGINTDTGLSGTTQWHNAVRARFYLKSIKVEAGEQPDNDLRELVFKKNQFGPMSANIVLRYRDGLFLPEGKMSGLEKVAHEAKAEEIFLELLKRFASEGRNVSHHATSKGYAPTAFAKETEAKASQLRKADFEDAMRRLFEAKKIHVEDYGRPSRPYTRITIKD
jgi:RecA-family ATPase